MQQFFSELARFFGNPFEAVTGLFESYGAWSASRRWIAILPMLPFALFAIVVYAYSGLSFSVGKESRTKAYLAQIDDKASLNVLERLVYRDVLVLADSNASNADVDADSAENSRSSNLSNDLIAAPTFASGTLEKPTDEALAEMKLTLERVIQINPNFDDGKYRLALVEALSGDRESAQQRIEQLANKIGIPHLAANHWYAVSLLEKRRNNEEVLDVKLADVLSRAVQWREARVPVRAAYAELLLRQGKIDESLAISESLANEFPARYLQVAAIARANGRERIFQAANSKAENYYESRMKTGKDKPEDRIGYAQTLLFSDRKEVAIEVLSSGIQNSTTEQPELRRALSMIYLNDFLRPDSQSTSITGLSSVKDVVKPDVTRDLALLEKSAAIDPMNPLLGKTIAMIAADASSTDLRITKPLTDVISRQIKEKAIAPDTLMILGGMYYQRGKYAQAEQFWNEIVTMQPNAIVALNNLAYLQIEKTPKDVNRGIELIERAFKLAPNNVEIADSYGRILFEAGQNEKAIAMLERALRIDPKRPKTRDLLVQAYRNIGQTTISDAQLRYIKSQAQTEDSADKEEASEAEKDAAGAPSEDGTPDASPTSTTPAAP